jgi:glutamate--cysteine ligase catalytic subunit
MGLLNASQVLSWERSKPWLQPVRSWAIEQFVHTFQSCRQLADSPRTFGEELETMTVVSNPANHEQGEEWSISLWPYGDGVIEELNLDASGRKEAEEDGGRWLYEYGSFMIECTPQRAYWEDLTRSLPAIERSMHQRLAFLCRHLPPPVCALLLANYPFLGRKDQLLPEVLTATFSQHDPLRQSTLSSSRGGQISHECLAELRDSADQTIAGTVHCVIPDVLICRHARFPTLTQLIRKRKGIANVVQIPRLLDDSSCIIVDGMVSGMGCCALQATFQCRDLDESLRLYDALLPLAPLMLAMSAGCAAFMGELAGWDCRWNNVGGTTDDRPPSEADDPTTKSRFSTSSFYLQDALNCLNDVPVCQQPEALARFKATGIPDGIARHFASILAKDPIGIYEDQLEQTLTGTGHFDVFQSTVWQSVRFKLPPSVDASAGIDDERMSKGWRVEFRTMDMQSTVKDNARLVVFLTLLVRSIVLLSASDYVERVVSWLPQISWVDANYAVAHRTDAIVAEQFHVKDGKLMPLREIFRAHLFPLLRDILPTLTTKAAQLVAMEAIDFVDRRLQGTEPTWAKRQRDFYLQHPAYAGDGRISTTMLADYLRFYNLFY